MAVYFNDLTIVKDDPQQNCRLLPEFFKVIKKLCEATGRKEKFVYADNKADVLGAAVSASGDQDLIMKYFTYIKTPCQDENAHVLMSKVEDHTEGEAEYYLAEGDRDKCNMMGWAHHKRSITLGLDASPFWRQLVYPIERKTLENDDLVVDIVESVCVTCEKQIDTSRVLGWIAAQRDFEAVELPESCPVKPEEKHIKVQMHDGRDEMMAFAEKLCRHPLVQGVIDNIAFDSTTNRFVLKCYEDGVIDLRMHWTKKGFGIKVQTMARGLPQTRLVADVLREKFDRRS